MLDGVSYSEQSCLLQLTCAELVNAYGVPVVLQMFWDCTQSAYCYWCSLCFLFPQSFNFYLQVFTFCSLLWFFLFCCLQMLPRYYHYLLNFYATISPTR